MNGPGMHSTALCRKEYISDLLRCVSFLYTGSFQLPKWQSGFFWLKTPSYVSGLVCADTIRKGPCVNDNQVCKLQPMKYVALLYLGLLYQLENDQLVFFSPHLCEGSACIGLPSSPPWPSPIFSLCRDTSSKCRSHSCLTRSIRISNFDFLELLSGKWPFSFMLPVSSIAASTHSYVDVTSW